MDILLGRKLKLETAASSVVLYMRGTPGLPMCGMSGIVCSLLKKAQVRFHYINLLRDPALMAFLQRTHKPATLPYLYVNGEFIGGYDEICELVKNNRNMFDIASGSLSFSQA